MSVYITNKLCTPVTDFKSLTSEIKKFILFKFTGTISLFLSKYVEYWENFQIVYFLGLSDICALATQTRRGTQLQCQFNVL